MNIAKGWRAVDSLVVPVHVYVLGESGWVTRKRRQKMGAGCKKKNAHKDIKTFLCNLQVCLGHW